MIIFNHNYLHRPLNYLEIIQLISRIALKAKSNNNISKIFGLRSLEFFFSFTKFIHYVCVYFKFIHYVYVYVCVCVCVYFKYNMQWTNDRIGILFISYLEN